ncbi:hypothetical protein DPEC_G00308590 [Dallia pectoralis]|uniref:Uncharacterized protein n=1 Tax=Dallia pectoralis TaxID=75939 RepID=A0ACC2FEP0_DALPE|nr:hypothetical protein DPEC_G00308590 [Dallia pectoralis]
METQRTVYLSLPKKYMASLAEKWELDHGLIIKDLSTHINEEYLKTYFQRWGNITACQIHKVQDSESETAGAMGFVSFSSEEEADMADWAGPHYVGGLDVIVKRIVAIRNLPTMLHSTKQWAHELAKANPKLAWLHWVQGNMPITVESAFIEKLKMAESSTEISFKKDLVSKLLSSFFREEKTRVSSDAVRLMAEMLYVFVEEAAQRTIKQAEAEDCDKMDIEHFEKILPQLLLDF